MPTTAIRTFTGQKLEPYKFPEDARTLPFLIGPSLDLAQGTVLGRKTADGKLYAYANGNADGTETAVAILPYAINTDANGKISLNDAASTGAEQGETYDSIPCYVRGWFKTTELVGLDASAVADLGRIVEGTLADGTLEMQ